VASGHFIAEELEDFAGEGEFGLRWVFVRLR